MMSLKDLSLKVKGMHCMGCAASVKDILESDVKGVKQAEVNLEEEKVNLSYDPDISNLQDMEKALKEAGYTLLV
jgi:copper chaperone CopZ